MIKSFALEGISAILLTTYFLRYALSRFPIFVFIDAVPNKSLLLLIAGVSLLLSMLICMIFGNDIIPFTTGIVMNALANACTWTSGTVLLSEYFGTKYFGYNYGWMLFWYGCVV